MAYQLSLIHIYLLPGGVGAGRPAPVLRVEDVGREGEFDALGVDVAHVFEHQLVEVRARRNGNCRQKVFSLARIVVRREGDPVVKQSQIEAVVPRLGRLPLQLGVVGLGTVGIDGVPAELVLGTVEPRRVDGDVAVVRNAVLLARHAVRYAELDVYKRQL